MTVADIKKAVEGLTDDAEVILVGWNHGKTGGDIFKATHQCANRDFQQSRNELWLSLEGLEQPSLLMSR